MLKKIISTAGGVFQRPVDSTPPYVATLVRTPACDRVKEISKNPIKDCEYNYQCDECLKIFKTAGLLRRHNKNDHEKFAYLRPW